MARRCCTRGASRRDSKSQARVFAVRARTAIAPEKDGCCCCCRSAFATDVPLLQKLLDAGAPASRRGTTSGCTALHAAAASGSVPAVEALVAAGCRVDAFSVTKRSALHVACMMGLRDVAEALVKAGADPYASRALTVHALLLHWMLSSH
jgi:ankyrin repeat protein